VSEPSPVALTRGVIEAINDRDAERLRGLLDLEVEVATGRSVRIGPDAALAWADKEYDHLVRRYAIDEVRIGDRGTLALGAVQYVWQEGGAVADSSPIAIELAFRDGLLRSLRVHDDAAAALAAFDS
jgi:hypothetical protein